MGILFLTKKEFLPSAACGGGCEREAVAGGGERAMMGGISPPPKNSLARIFTPPRKRRGVRQSAISLIPAPDFHSRPPLFHSRPPLPFPRKRESPCHLTVFGMRCRKTIRDWGDSRLRGNGRGGGNGNSFFDKKRILTLRRLRGGVRTRSGRGGWRAGDDGRHFSTPQKFAGANFYPPPQAAGGETIGNISHSLP